MDWVRLEGGASCNAVTTRSGGVGVVTGGGVGVVTGGSISLRRSAGASFKLIIGGSQRERGGGGLLGGRGGLRISSDAVVGVSSSKDGDCSCDPSGVQSDITIEVIPVIKMAASTLEDVVVSGPFTVFVLGSVGLLLCGIGHVSSPSSQPCSVSRPIKGTDKMASCGALLKAMGVSLS